MTPVPAAGGQSARSAHPARRAAPRRRPLPAAWAGAVLVVAVFALYAPLLARGFTSEDFLLLRVLGEVPPWERLRDWLAGPWLGIEVVRFYRPVSELLLAVEARLFGASPLAYGVVHVGLHAANGLLLWRLCRRLLASAVDDPRAADRAALAAGLLFAVHPLAPNAVAWVASYATLFATTFVLAAWWSWEGLRRRPGDAWRWLATAALFVAALGCYEAAVVLPAALLLRELSASIGPDHDTAAWSRRRGLLAVAGLAGLAVAYLAWRRAVVGSAVGGYASFVTDIAEAGPGGLLRDVLLCLQRLVHPVYGSSGPLEGGLVLAAAVLLPLTVILRRGDGRARLLALWGLGWGWALLFLAPFAFQPFVPANGRFAYLAAAGLALALSPLALVSWRGGGGADTPEERPARAARAPRTGRLLAVVGAAGLVLLAGHWLSLAIDHAGRLRAAGELAAEVRDDLLRQLAAGAEGGVAASAGLGPIAPEGARARTVWDRYPEDAAAGVHRAGPAGAAPQAGVGAATPVLVAGHPLFVTGPGGTPWAQVLRYGLSDALGPPFVTDAPSAGATPPVYPLPEGSLAAARLAFAAAGVPATALEWRPPTGSFQPVAPPRPPAATLRAELTGGEAWGAGPEDGAANAEEPRAGRAAAPLHIAVHPLPGAATYRVVILTRGNPTIVAVGTGAPSATGRESPRTAAAPELFVRSMRHLYAGPRLGGPVWWWAEAHAADGALLAVSPAARWPETPR